MSTSRIRGLGLMKTISTALKTFFGSFLGSLLENTGYLKYDREIGLLLN